MDDSEPLLETSNDGPKNEYIDKLTMELLLNKNHYSKYLAKTDPKKHDQFQEYKSKLRKYSVEIMDIMDIVDSLWLYYVLVFFF